MNNDTSTSATDYVLPRQVCFDNVYLFDWIPLCRCLVEQPDTGGYVYCPYHGYTVPIIEKEIEKGWDEELKYT